MINSNMLMQKVIKVIIKGHNFTCIFSMAYSVTVKILAVMKGFIEFIKSQGVIGLAVGFILGGEVAKLVDSMVDDLINPLLGIFLGSTGNLSEAYFRVGKAHVMWGHFVVITINFLIVALVVYIFVTKLKLDKHLDKKF